MRIVCVVERDFMRKRGDSRENKKKLEKTQKTFAKGIDKRCKK